MSEVTINKLVPDFSSASTAAGGSFCLKDARGAPLVLYFYPRDNTPGCTLEGQQFQALLPRFKRAGIRVVGISRDTLASHQKFCSKLGFSFELLAVCKLFDVMRIKNMYGKKVRGIERSTFLIDAKGVLRQEWRKLTVDGHAKAVLEAAKTL
jgi:thioredoxin-dependent peroxiredoxin